MSHLKRVIVFIISCAMILLVMSAVMEDEADAVSVFSNNAHCLSVMDGNTLLPISDCRIIIIGKNEYHKTDKSGRLYISDNDVSLIAKKDGYAPFLLLHHDFSKEDITVSLTFEEAEPFTTHIDSGYVQALIESYLPG